MLELIGGVTLITILWSLFLVSRYKRCPADKILVVYGKTIGGSLAEVHSGGGVFVWPVIQDFAYLDRKPLTVTTEVKDVLEEDGFFLSISGTFVVAIGETKSMMEAAANRLLTLSNDQIINLSEEMIKGQLRLVVNALASVELNDRKRLIDATYVGVNEQLNTIGLQLMNVDLDQVQFNQRSTSSQALSTSTEGLGIQPSAIDLILRSDQIDALLKGEAINIKLSDGGNSIRISGPAETN